MDEKRGRFSRRDPREQYLSEAQRLVDYGKTGRFSGYGVLMNPDDVKAAADAWEMWKGAQKAMEAEYISKMKAEQMAAQKLVPENLTMNDIKKIMETIGKKKRESWQRDITKDDWLPKYDLTLEACKVDPPCWACGGAGARRESVVEDTEIWACEEHWDGEEEWDEAEMEKDNG